jgi:hypothetical protein
MPDTKTGSHNVASVCDTMNAGDQFSMLHKRDNKAIGYSESIWQGRASSAEWTLSDTLTFQIQGTSPQNEEDTLPACRILVQIWNNEGGTWTEPIAGQDDVDCWVKSTSDSNDIVLIQVVRAISEPELWNELSISGRVSRENIERSSIAISLKKSIEKKASRMTESRRAKLCLALDATRLPGLCFDDNVAYFREYYGSWAGSLGFASIWLVGTMAGLVWRLDIGDPSEDENI